MNCLSDWNCRLFPSFDPSIEAPQTLQEAFLVCSERFGIKRFCLMPEYDSLSESVSLFLLRQDRMRKELQELLPKGLSARVGVAVLLRSGLHETMYLDRLRLKGSHCLPIMFPIGSYQDWMDLELNRLLYKAKQRLLFLSFDQLLIFYPEDVIERLMRIPDAVYQFNYRSLADPRACELLKTLCDRNATVIFGTGLPTLEKACFYEMEHYLLSARKALSTRQYEALLQSSHLFWNA